MPHSLHIGFTGLLLLFTMVSSAQVNNKGYQAMLKFLLAHDVPEMSVSDLFKSYTQWTVLDSREPEEYNVSHLPGARFIGYRSFDLDSLANIPKNEPLLVYCSVGKRSENMVRELIKEGYESVYNLYGGLFEWVNQHYAVVDHEGKQTARVHGYSRFWARFLERGDPVF